MQRGIEDRAAEGHILNLRLVEASRASHPNYALDGDWCRHLSYINYPETIVNSGFQNVGMDVFYVIETFMLELVLVLVWKWNSAWCVLHHSRRSWLHCMPWGKAHIRLNICIDTILYWSHIFVGAGLSDTSPSILLGAYASIGVITNNRTPHLSNSLYWYYRKGHYLGFFDTPDVLETNYPEGTDNYEILDIQHGSLWNIDGFGLRSRSSGLRSNLSSNVTHHARNSDLRIWIYNCPGKSPNCISLNLNNCEELAVNIACDYCIVEHFGGLMWLLVRCHVRCRRRCWCAGSVRQQPVSSCTCTCTCTCTEHNIIYACATSRGSHIAVLEVTWRWSSSSAEQ